ncbi:MAG: hypothetical protein ACOCRK_03945 [bacterium]
MRKKRPSEELEHYKRPSAKEVEIMDTTVVEESLMLEHPKNIKIYPHKK